MRSALVVLIVVAHCSTATPGASGGIGPAISLPPPTLQQATTATRKRPRAEIGRADSTSALQWLLGPSVPLARFFARHWEQAPLLVQRNDENYYDAALSFSNETFLALVDAGDIRHGRNVHWSRYRKGAREEKALAGRASGGSARRLFAQGYTAQLFAPQHASARIARLCRRLEGEFRCLVGCSAYLTPPRSQGLAPHHDDIEAFVLQLQGRKRWRVYAPRVPLASSHSGDYDRATLGDALLDVVLEAGDLLYMPRGAIHEATTAVAEGGDSFSTHLTLSTYQMQSWASVLARALAGAVERAEEQHVGLRQGIPLDALRHLGYVHTLSPQHAPDPRTDTHARTQRTPLEAEGSAGGVWGGDSEAERRAALQAQAAQLLQVVLRDFNASLDAAVDEMAVDFVQTRLPPARETKKQKREREREEGPGGSVEGDVWVQLRDVDALRVVRCPLTAEDGGGSGVRLLTSRHNRRRKHMAAAPDDEGMHAVVATLPARFAPALALLVRYALLGRWLPLSLLVGGEAGKEPEGRGAKKGERGVEAESDWKSLEELGQEERALLLTVLGAQDLLRKRVTRREPGEGKRKVKRDTT